MTIELRHYLNEIKETVAVVAPDAEIILFGSQARGDARPDSDIDLLILVDRDELSWKDLCDITGPVYDLQIKYMIDIQLIVRTRRQWFERPFRTPFYVNVMNEGVRI